METRNGGAVHNLGALHLDGVVAKNNASQFQGGAIYSTGTVGMTGGEISDNLSSFGAGIYTTGSAAFTGVSFFRNHGSQGGAINNSGTVTIRDSQFAGNASAFGSAVNNSGFHAVASIVNSTIQYNIGTHNGAIKSIGTLSIDATTIANNSGVWGAGIDTSGTATISNSTISGNSAGADGGGISNTGTLTLVNSTISGNSAKWSGGGIEFSGGAATLRNVTVTGNRADSDDFGTDNGGGLSVKDGFATARLYNTIVVGNFLGFGSTYNDVAGPFVTDSRNNVVGATGTAGSLENGTNRNIVGVAAATVLEPVLKDNGGPTKTHALLAGSVAVDAGNAAEATGRDGNPLVSDQRGSDFPRVARDRVDIGAVERANSAPISGALQFSTGENSLLTGNLLTNVDDPEDDELQVVAIKGHASLVGQVFVLASGAQILINADGSFAYDPAGAFADLKFGETAVESFTYTVSDTFGGTTIAAVEIAIHGAGARLITDINPATTELSRRQSESDIDIGADGTIVVAWMHSKAPSGWDVRFRRYASNGGPLDATDRSVSLRSTRLHGAPSVAVAPDGAFAIGYERSPRESAAVSSWTFMTPRASSFVGSSFSISRARRGPKSISRSRRRGTWSPCGKRPTPTTT